MNGGCLQDLDSNPSKKPSKYSKHGTESQNAWIGHEDSNHSYAAPGAQTTLQMPEEREPQIYQKIKRDINATIPKHPSPTTNNTLLHKRTGKQSVQEEGGTIKVIELHRGCDVDRGIDESHHISEPPTKSVVLRGKDNLEHERGEEGRLQNESCREVTWGKETWEEEQWEEEQWEEEQWEEEQWEEEQWEEEDWVWNEETDEVGTIGRGPLEDGKWWEDTWWEDTWGKAISVDHCSASECSSSVGTLMD